MFGMQKVVHAALNAARRHRRRDVGLKALLAFALATPVAHAESPSNAVMVETKEQDALLGARLHALVDQPVLSDRGLWLTALDPAPQAQLNETVLQLSPAERDNALTSQFMNAFNAFPDVKTRPFCVFALVPNGEPLLYGDQRYSLPNGPLSFFPLRDSPAQPGQFGARGNSNEVQVVVQSKIEVDGRTFTGLLDAAKVGSGYAALVSAKKKVGEAARYRSCLRFVRVDEQTDMTHHYLKNKVVVLQWLGTDLIDNRSGSSLVQIPTSWAAQ